MVMHMHCLVKVCTSIVERVDVHQGCQAVVGNIQRGMGDKEKKINLLKPPHP